MNEVSLPAQRRRRLGLQLPRLDYGPYFLLPAIPWLLLATILRAKARLTYDPSLLLFIVLGQFAVFLAFLIASQMMIRSAGGVTALGRIQFSDQLRFAWGTVWRIWALFLAAGFASYHLKTGIYVRDAVLFAFDGIVFPWKLPLLPVWSALAATLVFLAIVERGMDRKPTGKTVLREFGRRIRHLGPAIIYVATAIFIIQAVQFAASAVVLPGLRSMSSITLSNILSVGFLLTFSYVRLHVTILILTLAVKASYRQDSAASA